MLSRFEESLRFDRRVWLLLVAMLVFRFGQGMYFPFSTIHYHNVVGIPLSLVGVGLGALAVASVASGLVSGPLSDRYGRKPVMLAALAGSAAAFAAFAFVEGFAGYLLVSVAAGLAGNTTFDAARNAMVADVTEPGRRARAYGLVRVGGNAGWALGPMAAGLTAASVGSEGVYRALFLGASALVTLLAVVLALMLKESLPTRSEHTPRPGDSGLRSALADGPFLALLAAGVLLYYVFTQDWQALPIYAKNFLGVPDGRIGLFLGANGLMVILLQLPISYAIDRTSKVWALLTGAALFAASSATLLLTESFLGILVAFAIFFTLAEMTLEVAGAALAADLAPVRLRGTYLALFGACFGAAYGVSPIVAGALLEARLPAVIWQIQLLAAALAAIALVVLRAISRRQKAEGYSGTRRTSTARSSRGFPSP
ncbi:MAG TPA: MFS transporter [Rubrobacteraceae bacterium]|nr:MFS transporter [Rubrobacteraceae bacterium]